MLAEHARCRGVAAVLGADERVSIDSVGGYLGHPAGGGGRWGVGRAPGWVRRRFGVVFVVR